MPEAVRTTRVFLLGNPDKAESEVGLAALASFAQDRCDVVGAVLGFDAGAAVDAKSHRLVVLGGDGTLIGAARSLREHQIPIIGVNAGKLGFLAEFSMVELQDSFDRAITDDTLIGRRACLGVSIAHNDATRDVGMAVNDCVIQAGPPFRMIELGVTINDQPFTTLRGDGVIICTPSGSTAHNLSAGGPLMQPGVDAIVLTPLCAHSLTHRPMVFERETIIEILAHDVNPGTALIIDGQVSCPLRPGDRVIVRRYGHDVLLVGNPLYARWHKLMAKLHWGQAPNY